MRVRLHAGTTISLSAGLAGNDGALVAHKDAFDSRAEIHFVLVAQLVEHRLCNATVVRSTRIGDSILTETTVRFRPLRTARSRLVVPDNWRSPCTGDQDAVDFTVAVAKSIAARDCESRGAIRGGLSPLGHPISCDCGLDGWAPDYESGWRKPYVGSSPTGRTTLREASVRAGALHPVTVWRGISGIASSPPSTLCPSSTTLSTQPRPVRTVRRLSTCWRRALA